MKKASTNICITHYQSKPSLTFTSKLTTASFQISNACSLGLSQGCTKCGIPIGSAQEPTLRVQN